LYPAEFVAGDYFDYLPVADGSVGFAIGDVAGHGFAPALLMCSLHTILRLVSRSRSDVGEIMSLGNRHYFEVAEEERFVTLLLGLLNPQSRVFTYASAGHPFGYVLDDSGAVKRQLRGGGLPLGILSDSEYRADGAVVLDPGDVVLMFTDGVQEARSREEVAFGPQRVLEVARANRAKTAAGIIESLHLAVCEFTKREKPADDITAVVIKVG
jgi:sigma-B regulation protein RsbU (phosphoserine phosphatase)